MLDRAVLTDHPMPAIEAAVAMWPFDPTYRVALVEWPYTQITNPTDAIEGLTEFLNNDPISPDAIKARIFYESRVPGMQKAMQVDAQALQRMLPMKGAY